jgi:gliding motility-associated-like protein
MNTDAGYVGMKFVYVWAQRNKHNGLVKMSIRLISGLLMGLLLSLAGYAWATPAHRAAPVSGTCPAVPSPQIQGDRAVVCRGDAAVLTASGCPGVVIWSTGETGNSIRVRPHQTTRYTAVCRVTEASATASACVSCFAEAYTVTVGTPEAPLLATDTPLVCPGDAVTLQATCTGTVEWTDTALSGASPTVRPTQTTTYEATCLKDGCRSNHANPLTISTATANVPSLSVMGNPTALCVGQSVTLMASQCAGQVRWSDGGTGPVRVLTVGATTRYRAVCRVGTCQSDSSAVLALPVQPMDTPPALQPIVQNACPFQTADLRQALAGAFDPALTYEFHTNASPTSPLVQSPGAVLAGNYYVFARNRAGCLSAPVVVSASISACANAIAPCQSNPAAAQILVDTLDRQRGVVCLRARLIGSATDPAWACTGTGLLTLAPPTHPRYVASEADRQRGTVTFSLSTPDPDGSGPCVGASTKLTVAVSASVATPIRTDSVQVVVNVPETNGVFIPDGFSPNDDGINDRFVIRGVSPELTVGLEVFNRWGHRVYTADNYQNDWDGKPSEGTGINTAKTALPDGTYFYVVRISDGREYVRFITISR